MIVNARDEMMKVSNGRDIKCAALYRGFEVYQRNLICSMRVNHTSREWVEFWDALDVNYDNEKDGYSGTIWYTDGTWLERSHPCEEGRWEHRSCPPIPEFLR